MTSHLASYHHHDTHQPAPKTAGTLPDIRVRRIVSLIAECQGIWPPLHLREKTINYEMMKAHKLQKV